MEQFVTRDEVESWKLSPFLFEVSVQVLLDAVHLLVELDEVFQFIRGAVEPDVSLLQDFLHQLVPRLVHVLEFEVVLLALCLDVLGLEDVLQVQPLPLAHLPLVDCL